ncbi:unnamed protein product [Amoebophrya sp. A25]|nr:unnamed protein product [Amoebophrya sp. A25]|eukprot:GSA25T00020276001.1
MSDLLDTFDDLLDESGLGNGISCANEVIAGVQEERAGVQEHVVSIATEVVQTGGGESLARKGDRGGESSSSSSTPGTPRGNDGDEVVEQEVAVNIVADAPGFSTAGGSSAGVSLKNGEEAKNDATTNDVQLPTREGVVDATASRAPVDDAATTAVPLDAATTYKAPVDHDATATSKAALDPTVMDATSSSTTEGATPTTDPASKSYNWGVKSQFAKPSLSDTAAQLERIREQQRERRQKQAAERMKAYEKNSGFHISERCLSQEKFDACMRDKIKVELRDIRRLVSTGGFHDKTADYKDPAYKGKNVVLIVIAIHFQDQQSLGDGQVCAQWKICDLPTVACPQATVVTLRLFSGAFLTWTKSQEAKNELKKGSVFAILNPAVSLQPGTARYFARVTQAAQIVKLGECEDVGYCAALSGSNGRGELCGQPINVRTCPSGLCYYHNEKQYASSTSGAKKTEPGVAVTLTSEAARETTKKWAAIGHSVKTSKEVQEKRKQAQRENTKERDLWFFNRKNANEHANEAFRDAKLSGRSLTASSASTVPLLGRGIAEDDVILFDEDDITDAAKAASKRKPASSTHIICTLSSIGGDKNSSTATKQAAENRGTTSNATSRGAVSSSSSSKVESANNITESSKSKISKDAARAGSAGAEPSSRGIKKEGSKLEALYAKIRAKRRDKEEAAPPVAALSDPSAAPVDTGERRLKKPKTVVD